MGERSIAEKLLIKAGTASWTSHPDRLTLVDPLPAEVRAVDALASAAVGLVFADDAQSLRALLDANRGALASPPVLWVLYPKANRTDINRDSVWPILAEHGLRPVTQVAVDGTWSALRFRPLRPGEAPFGG